MNSLQKLGIPTRLRILGGAPPEGQPLHGAEVLGRLDKSIPAQREKINRLYSQSHFLILPTRADCSPIVIPEANAFGLPAITTEVGGVPSLIRDGRNGRLLPLSATGEDFARVVAKDFQSREQYLQFSRSARKEYETRLNWSKWGERLEEILRQVVDSP